MIIVYFSNKSGDYSFFLGECYLCYFAASWSVFTVFITFPPLLVTHTCAPLNLVHTHLQNEQDVLFSFVHRQEEWFVPKQPAIFSPQILHSILILMYQHLFMDLKTVPMEFNTFSEMSNNISINKTGSHNTHDNKGSTPT